MLHKLKTLAADKQIKTKEEVCTDLIRNIRIEVNVQTPSMTQHQWTTIKGIFITIASSYVNNEKTIIPKRIMKVSMRILQI